MIKQPWLLALSAVCLLLAIGLAAERTIFLVSAERTQGRVTSIESRNDRCGSKKQRYDCTEFSANVQYQIPAGAVLAIQISAGSSRGSNQPDTSASHRVGDSIPVVYSPSRPTKAYQDTLWGVWGAPLIALGVQIATLFGSLSEGRRRQR